MRLWAAPAARGLTGELSAQTVLERLFEYLHHDIAMYCTRQQPMDVKLMQFWLAQVNKLLTAFPSQAPACWTRLLRWVLAAQAHTAR